ncbi:MAG: helix-turn-helix transcriptional regulator [Clostridiales bacterium]|nr:helix-turn-helix transcriptional regulator [Clostridiales bacterium]
MRTKFAENFSDILKIKNISQSQFARLYGVKQNTVSQWANGKREPTYHDLLRICTLFDIEIHEILGYTPRVKKAILRDIIGSNQEFQKQQKQLIEKMEENKSTLTEIQYAIEELYQKTLEEYKTIFGFTD